jgi:tetratricopeptide (TPR) repeat protein
MSRTAAVLVAALILSPAAAQQKKDDQLPLSKLPPAKVRPNQCLLTYRVSTRSPECQAHFDQGLGYFYSYVWMEAARSFETAARCDPDCAMAWWGLSRALDEWKGNVQMDALKKAQVLLPKASDRERRLITARLQLKGLIDKLTKDDDRRRAAVKTLDELISLYEDDEEAWFARAKLAGDGKLGPFSTDGRLPEIPFYKALLRINPLHPGANHELVHIYEGTKRPALGWVHAEGYIKSSPGIPHAWHMQAHLAMRLGRWDATTDRSCRAIELEKQYHREMNVKPRDDHQFDHQLETLTKALIHDGRFREAREIKAGAWADGYRHWPVWFRLHLAEHDWDEALKVVEHYRKSDKTNAAYLAALVYLAKGDPDRAKPEMEVLQGASSGKRPNRLTESRLWEVQGLLMCQTGAADEGLKLLQRCVEKTKDDYGHHAWGNGAYYMEQWGSAALACGKYDVAEEAFLEALAHDAGSAKAALGMQVACERTGRPDEAARYAALAKRCWRHAEVRHFDELRAACGGKAEAE